MIARLSCVLLCFLLYQNLYSQSYYFRRYKVENGLSNNAVISCLQDRKGFLWFGTKDGLNRFDGYTFKNFRNNPDDSGSIGSNFIPSLYEDPNGVLWAGTETGLYRYEATTESFRLLPGTQGHIRDIQMDASGHLWFISGFTLVRHDARTKALELYSTDRHFEATSVSISPDGTLWVSTTGGRLQRYHAPSNFFTSFDLFAAAPKGASRWIENIFCTTEGTVLAGLSTGGAKIFDVRTAATKDILTRSTEKTDIFVRNFVQTSGSEYWIATEYGIYILNTKTGQTTNLRKRYNDPNSISDNAVYTFCKDREGGIWAGTYFGGVNYHPKQYAPFRKYFPKTGENALSGNVVREIRQDAKGHLWIGTEDAGLNRLDPATGKFTHYGPTGKPGDISYSNIHGLLIRGDELWVGTFEHGLDVLHIPTGKVIRHYSEGPGPNQLKSNFIYCLYGTEGGDILVGTTRGAYRYNGATDDFTPLPGMPLLNWYASLMQDKKGRIWGATFGNGVNFYDAATGTSGNFRYHPKDRKSLSSDRVNSILEDSRGTLWFATEDGLCRMSDDRKSFRRYTTANGFPSNFILSLLEDDLGLLWISTSKGLVQFHPGKEQVSVYSRANGILNDQFNFNSAYKDREGRMYFGSVEGMISFHPSRIYKNDFIPPVYITGFQVHNEDLPIGQNGSPLKQSVTVTDKITLDHDQSTFSIDFAALSYTAPQMSEYTYKMVGLDKGWTYLKGNRKVYFTDLSPGTYAFMVKASNSSGVWNEKETRLLIKILPPWWASWWAYGLYVILGVAGLSYGIRGYHQRVEEKNRRKIELLEAAKEKEIYEAKIEFFTNVAHEIKTPLTLIKGPVEKLIRVVGGMPEIADCLRIMDRNTNRLIDLTNQLLDFRQTEIRGFSLSFVRANISDLLEEHVSFFQPLAEGKKLQFQLEKPERPYYASVDVEAFNKIISNLLSNGVKYAGKTVYVRLLPREEEGLFTIEVGNDGYLIPYDMGEKIFEPFFRLKQTEKQKGTGIGLALSRSLTQLHKGTLLLKEPQNGFNLFSLTLPQHQDNEFLLNGEERELPTLQN